MSVVNVWAGNQAQDPDKHDKSCIYSNVIALKLAPWAAVTQRYAPTG